MALDATLAPALPVPASPSPGATDATGAAPDSDTGRAFRALLGRHQGDKAAGPLDRGALRGDETALPGTDAATPADATSAGATEDTTAPVGDETPPAAPLDPALQHLLQPATLPAQAAPRALEATGRTTAPADGSGALPGLHGPGPGPGDTRRPATPPGEATAAAHRPALAGAGDGPAAGTAPVVPAAAGAASFAARLAEALGPAEQRAPGELSAAPLPVLPQAAPAAAVTTAAAPAAEVASAATATLIASPDSAAFPGEFGVQIATFAQDGIEHAELHLNPAEMGPVAVQIALDGTQARVELRADLAATREALQQSLPALAAALREAGLTLAGGSVSSQAGQQGRQGDGRGRDGEPGTPRLGRNDGAPPTAPVALRRGLRLGGVDLYA